MRRKKVYTASEQTKNLNYNVTDTDYQLTSVNPELIVGAMQLWTFNTKTKEITKFVADDRGGLGVKGTTIQKFNNYSAMKKIGNKTEYFLDRIQSGGKIVLSINFSLKLLLFCSIISLKLFLIFLFASFICLLKLSKLSKNEFCV